jgi:hypothetical protein
MNFPLKSLACNQCQLPAAPEARASLGQAARPCVCVCVCVGGGGGGRWVVGAGQVILRHCVLCEGRCVSNTLFFNPSNVRSRCLTHEC